MKLVISLREPSVWINKVQGRRNIGFKDYHMGEVKEYCEIYVSGHHQNSKVVKYFR